MMPNSDRPHPISTNRLGTYDRLIATQPGAERKGAKVPYTSLNGNMFSYLDDKGTIALRLSLEDRTVFMDAYGASLQQAHGIVQKEYVAVPDALASNTAELTPWFAASYRYAASLRPKPTTRKK